MIRLEDYPHVPYWYARRQAMAIVREGGHLRPQGEGGLPDRVGSEVMSPIKVAFARRQENSWAVVAAARFFTRILPAEALAFDPEVWQESFLSLPSRCTQQNG